MKLLPYIPQGFISNNMKAPLFGHCILRRAKVVRGRPGVLVDWV